MLKKILLAGVVVSCFSNKVAALQVSMNEINQQFSHVPFRNRLFILEARIREKHAIPFKEQTTEEEERRLIDSIHLEGIKSLRKGDIETAESLLELLGIPGDIFHFSSRHEKGEFSLENGFFEREKRVCNYSYEKRDSLDSEIEKSCGSDIVDSE